jgi:hypothetical protein
LWICRHSSPLPRVIAKLPSTDDAVESAFVAAEQYNLRKSKLLAWNPKLSAQTYGTLDFPDAPTLGRLEILDGSSFCLYLIKQLVLARLPSSGHPG